MNTLRNNNEVQFRRVVPGLAAAVGLLATACGTNASATEGNAALVASDASGMTYEIIPGGDAETAALAASSACGGDENVDYSTKKHLDVMSIAENSDLLASKENRLVEIVGPDAVRLLAERSIVLSEDAPLTEGLSAYQMMIAKSVPLQLSPETVEANPLRANFMCVDTDGSGIGDRVEFANLATNINANGSPVDLVSVVVPMEDYKEVIAASSANGFDFESKLITQPIFIEVKNPNGDIEIVEMMVVFFADNNCLNPVEKTHIKLRKDGTPTTVDTTTPDGTTIPDSTPPTTVVVTSSPPTLPTTVIVTTTHNPPTTAGTTPPTTAGPSTTAGTSPSTTGRKGDEDKITTTPPPPTTAAPRPTTSIDTLPPLAPSDEAPESSSPPTTYRRLPTPSTIQPTDAAPVSALPPTTAAPADTTTDATVDNPNNTQVGSR